MSKKEDGMIQVDSDFGKKYGFTSDRFLAISYLWKVEKQITISFIHSVEEGKGYFKDLVGRLEADGYEIGVPTPLAQMQSILTRWGFVPTMIHDEDLGGVELWRRKPHDPQ